MRKRILLVEAAGSASFHQVQLANAGYTVKLVSAAAGAAGAAEAFGPDLVILDVERLDGDGVEAARRLQGAAAAPVLLLVPGGQASAADDLEGTVDYLPKPLAGAALIAGVNQRLRAAGGTTDGSPAERRPRAPQLVLARDARPA